MNAPSHPAWWALAVVALWKVSARGRQSGAYVLWGVLGWLGPIIGLRLMLGMPKRTAR